MLYTTLSKYKENYQTNLDAFLKEYEDNTESIFLQNELNKYNDFLEILIRKSTIFAGITSSTFADHIDDRYLRSKVVDLDNLENYITSAKRIIDFINIKIDSIRGHIETKTLDSNTNYKSQIWFKVGLLFANGDLNKYFNPNKTTFKYGYSASKVAIEIGFENYQKYILATINNYAEDNTNGDKNIFNSKFKMLKIIDHCTENQINIDPFFLSRLPEE